MGNESVVEGRAAVAVVAVALDGYCWRDALRGSVVLLTRKGFCKKERSGRDPRPAMMTLKESR